MSFVEQLAKQIVQKYNESPQFRARVAESMEPYRAMVYESGCISRKALETFDGTDEWCKLIDEIEFLINWPQTA